MPVVFAACLWLAWNALIFGSPLHFALGPYSAHAQQGIIEQQSGLITKGNMVESALAYFYAVADNLGIYLILASVWGALVYIFSTRSRIGNSIAIFLILVAPIVFNILALYSGFSILNVPQLHWNPSGRPSGQWFNVRYGILGLPFVSVGVGLLAQQVRKWGSSFALFSISVLVIITSFSIYRSGLITIKDGTKGDSAFVYTDIANVLHADAKPGDAVLMSMTFYNPVEFKSGLPLKSFITEGVSGEWEKALKNPNLYAQWVVASQGDKDEPIYASELENDPQAFLTYYSPAYCDINTCVYRLKSTDQIFVADSGTGLVVGDQPYTLKGVTINDLAYESTSTIDKIFLKLHTEGINTVRFNMSRDGDSYGFQTAAGILNTHRLENADYLIADAQKYNIRVIPVLLDGELSSNDISQYLEWVGVNPTYRNEFYTYPVTVKLYENYINHILSRDNTITGMRYSDDPTILSWEIISDPPSTGVNQAAYKSWVMTISSYIKSQDSTHLINIGIGSTPVGAANGSLEVTEVCPSSVTFCLRY
ncbi:MAG: hypothetical protein ACREGH_01690 [Minisyncoccia bacterium]